MRQRLAIIFLLLVLTMVAFDYLLPPRSEILEGVATLMKREVLPAGLRLTRSNFTSVLGDEVMIYEIFNPTDEVKQLESLALDGRNISLGISLGPNESLSLGIIRDFTVVVRGTNATLLNLTYYPSNRWLEVRTRCNSSELELLVFSKLMPSRVETKRSVRWSIDLSKGVTRIRLPCSIQTLILDFASYPYGDSLILDQRRADVIRYEIAKLRTRLEVLEGEIETKRVEISQLRAELANLSLSVNGSVDEKNKLALSLAALRSNLAELNQTLAKERTELEQSLILPYPFALVIGISLVALLLYVASLLYSKGEQNEGSS